MGHVPKCAESEKGFNDLASSEDAVEDDNDDDIDYTLEDDNDDLNGYVGVIETFDIQVRNDNRVELPAALVDIVGGGFFVLSKFKNSIALDSSKVATDFFLEKGMRLTKSFMLKNLPSVAPGDFVCIQVIKRSSGDYRLVIS
jgi:hypothetical protein